MNGVADGRLMFLSEEGIWQVPTIAYKQMKHGREEMGSPEDDLSLGSAAPPTESVNSKPVVSLSLYHVLIYM